MCLRSRDAAPTDGGSAVAVADRARALASLERAIEVVRAEVVDDLTEADLSAELAVLERVGRQVSARQSRVVAALAERRARRARDAARSAGRAEDSAAQRASRELRRELSDDLGWSASEAKRTLELGRRLGGDDEAGQAFDRGELAHRHAAVLADTLKHLGGRVREDARAELLEASRTQDAVEFGRTCRRLLARLDGAAAQGAAANRRARRTAKVWHDPDGMTGVSAQLSGVDAEVVTTAWQAFRRPDAPDERRTPEQAGADALVAMARAALDAGVAPHDRRLPPHVQITIDWRDVLADAGVAEGAWTGPLPMTEVRRMLADCGVSRLLTDPDGVPMEAGRSTRNVPAGLYRALTVRDRGCIADGCDVPAVWCQVMHLATPYRLGGRLTIDTAALGCAHHHAAHDLRGWTVTWHRRRPVLHHPERPPRSLGADPPRHRRAGRPTRPVAGGADPPAARRTGGHGSTSAAHPGQLSLPDP